MIWAWRAPLGSLGMLGVDAGKWTSVCGRWWTVGSGGDASWGERGKTTPTQTTDHRPGDMSGRVASGLAGWYGRMAGMTYPTMPCWSLAVGRAALRCDAIHVMADVMGDGREWI